MLNDTIQILLKSNDVTGQISTKSKHCGHGAYTLSAVMEISCMVCGKALHYSWVILCSEGEFYLKVKQ